MRKITNWLLGVAVVGLALIANVASASACYLGHYQPEVPETLRR